MAIRTSISSVDIAPSHQNEPPQSLPRSGPARIDLDQSMRNPATAGLLGGAQGEEIDHFAIAHLMEIAIIEADSAQFGRRFQADGLIGLFAQSSQGVGRRYRHGEDQPRGPTVPHGLQS